MEEKSSPSHFQPWTFDNCVQRRPGVPASRTGVFLTFSQMRAPIGPPPSPPRPHSFSCTFTARWCPPSAWRWSQLRVAIVAATAAVRPGVETACGIVAREGRHRQRVCAACPRKRPGNKMGDRTSRSNYAGYPTGAGEQVNLRAPSWHPFPAHFQHFQLA